MAELKTKKNDASVGDFLAKIADDEIRKDANALLRLLKRATGEKPKMWGTSIVGFGEIHYEYPSGREGDWPPVGFSPRAKNLTLYLMAGFGKMQPKLAKLGKHSKGRSCLHVRRLADVDAKVLESIVKQGLVEAKAIARKTKRA